MMILFMYTGQFGELCQSIDKRSTLHNIKADYVHLFYYHSTESENLIYFYLLVPIQFIWLFN